MSHRLKAILASNTELRQLSRKAEQLTTLQQHFESITPSGLAHNSHVLKLDQQTVVIAANNGAVATKLRQMTSELISLFQARGCEVTGIQIKVQVYAPPPVVPHKPLILGKAARDALNKLDENLPDSPLKAALHRLGRRP
ncbi:MAG: DUF721 domain-containing protein [Gammaproteobacteria bacterium]|nr:DUF721 domain-containing protein [Gammaproteobacteria bacterium]MBU1482845.1 DUF721 domain-containing protein [Gammaproteobacteria bacterium]